MTCVCTVEFKVVVHIPLPPAVVLLAHMYVFEIHRSLNFNAAILHANTWQEI